MIESITNAAAMTSSETISKQAFPEPKVNIIIAGQTGVGKSTLTNAIMGRDVAV